MLEALRLLVGLQDMDSLIIGKAALIEAAPKRISTAQQPLKDAQLSLERHKQRHEAIEKKKREKERLLDEMNDNIRKLKARSTEVKTNKEYQAHLKEIEAAERERIAVEDDILALMEAIESSQKELNAEIARVKEEKEKIEAFEKRLKEDIAEAEKELNKLKHQRDGLVDAIDKDLYSLYMKAFGLKKGSAVAEARDERCMGCNMNIPPQLFVEIKKNERVIQCPQCGRILCWKG